MSLVKNHPNRIPFEGVLSKLNQPSDKAPNGSRGHRVMLSTAAAEEALDSLIGMAVAFKDNWDGHDARQKCGVITFAEIVGDNLCVRGHLYGRDFPEVLTAMGKPGVAMGMSYEMIDCMVEDQRATIWSLSHVTFTGAAILLRSSAAYGETSFTISASADDFTGWMEVEGGIAKLGDES